MDIVKANKSKDKPNWEVAYRASELFGVNSLLQLGAVVEKLQNMDKDEKLFNDLLTNFVTGAPRLDDFKAKWGILYFNFRNSK
jgi:hypothetical protein